MGSSLRRGVAVPRAWRVNGGHVRWLEEEEKRFRSHGIAATGFHKHAVRTCWALPFTELRSSAPGLLPWRQWATQAGSACGWATL